MKKTIVGVFNTRKDAEDVTYQLRNEGYNLDNVSIITKNPSEYTTDNTGYTNTADKGDRATNDNISDGVTAGSILGGVAGLLIGAGTFAVPGLGVIAAAGPLAGLISGAVTGGIVGALIDLGVPENESRQYETDIKSGKVFLSVTADEENSSAIQNILNSYGATQVNVY